MPSFPGPHVIVSLDYADKAQALALIEQLDPKLCRLKVGKQMFTHYGPQWVEQLMQLGFDIFLDLKFHDIPNTVTKACLAAADLGVWMVNVHTLGGTVMLEAVANAYAQRQQAPLLIGVTVLTSLVDEELAALSIQGTVQENVLKLAKLAQNVGLDGVVSSAQEARSLRAHCGPNFCLVTPGIRCATDAAQDQKRIVTPVQAIQNGADYLVIGRSITQAQNPAEVLNTIVDAIHED